MFKHPDEVTISSVFSDPQDITKQIHTSGRSDVWDVALKIFFIDSPLLGSGVGATQEWFYGDATSRKQVGVLHSEYLRLLCEVGIIGLILFILAMLAYLHTLSRVFIRSTLTLGLSSEARHYSVVGISSFVFYLITLATDNSIDYVTALGIFVFSSVGLTVCAYSQEQNSLKTTR